VPRHFHPVRQIYTRSRGMLRINGSGGESLAYWQQSSVKLKRWAWKHSQHLLFSQRKWVFRQYSHKCNSYRQKTLKTSCGR
jgi:hypothetical protein